MRAHRSILSILLLCLWAAPAVGCQVSSSDIAHWKRTQKGPGKIVAVLLSDQFSVALRAEALVALLELDRSDVDGVQQLGLALERLAEERSGTLPAIIESATPRVIAMLPAEAAPEPAQAPEGEQAASAPSVPPLQINAKDAAFRLAEHAEGETRAQLARAVLDWFAVDYPRRGLLGTVSGEQAAAAFGEDGARMLIRAMDARMPKDMLPRMAERAQQLGGPDTRAEAAARLVEIERAMEGPEFLDWLKGQIRRALAQGGEAPSEEHVEATAVHNRERFINDGVLPAMKHLAGEAAVADRLLEIASSVAPAGLGEALLASFDERRARALAALEGNAKPEHIPRLLPLALGEAVPLAVRDLAFNRLGETERGEVIDSMWPLIEAEPGRMVPTEEAELARLLRTKASELVLHLSGTEAIEPLLRRLPRARDATFEPEELEVYASVISDMQPPPTERMRAQVQSPYWWRRALAALYLARVGDESDVPALERLAADTAPTMGLGWRRGDPSRDTVGKVATGALQTMRDRSSAPEQTPVEPSEQ